jgi:hypothetical protein
MNGMEDKLALTVRDAYKAIGVNYRYFLTWRHQLLAGYLTLVAALGIAFSWLNCYQEDLIWVPFIAGLMMTLLFWALDVRNRDLYHACQRSGMECERGLPKGVGLFTRLHDEAPDDNDDRKKRSARITHSRAMDTLFALMGLLMLICLVASVVAAVLR